MQGSGVEAAQALPVRGGPEELVASPASDAGRRTRAGAELSVPPEVTEHERGVAVEVPNVTRLVLSLRHMHLHGLLDRQAWPLNHAHFVPR